MEEFNEPGLTQDDLALLEADLDDEGHQIMDDFRLLLDRVNDLPIENIEYIYMLMIKQIEIKMNQPLELGILKNAVIIGYSPYQARQQQLRKIESTMVIPKDDKWVEQPVVDSRKKFYGVFPASTSIAILITNSLDEPIYVKVVHTYLESGRIRRTRDRLTDYHDVVVPPGKKLPLGMKIDKINESVVKGSNHRIELYWIRENDPPADEPNTFYEFQLE